MDKEALLVVEDGEVHLEQRSGGLPGGEYAELHVLVGESEGAHGAETETETEAEAEAEDRPHHHQDTGTV
jgi:hypothetical protein